MSCSLRKPQQADGGEGSSLSSVKAKKAQIRTEFSAATVRRGPCQAKRREKSLSHFIGPHSGLLLPF